MIKMIPYPDIFRFALYPILILILIAYKLYVHRKNRELQLPVGLFVCYFLIMAGITIISEFELPYVLNLLELLSTIFLTIAVIRLLVFIVVDYFMRFKGFARIPLITRDIGLAVVYLIAVLIILRYQANVNLASLITTSAVLTAVIGLALQDTLGNLFSGIVLQMEKPYHLGDWVSFDRFTGRVVGMTWKSTKVVTREKELVCIPNNLIAKSHILNYTQPDPEHVAQIEIGASYNDPPNNVREAILKTLAEHPSVKRVPEPEVRVVKYNDFSIDYLTRFYLSDFENEEKIKAHILNQIWYRFRRVGITIPFPIRTIQQVSKDPEKEASEKDHVTRVALESLQGIDIFSPLSEDDFSKLALLVRFETFSVGEVIISEGAFDKSMYAIVSGECDIIINEGTRDKHIVATLKDGQFFGEMSLLTGEPRTATVRANMDMVCIKIEKRDMEGIITAHPAVATAMSEILAVRKEDLTAQKDTLAKAKAPNKKLAAQLLTKIKSFFNI